MPKPYHPSILYNLPVRVKSYLFLLCIGVFFSCFAATAQNKTLDSLQKVLQTQKDDTNKVNTLNNIAKFYGNQNDYSKALDYAGNALTLSKKLNFKTGMISAYRSMGDAYSIQPNPGETDKYYKLAASLIVETGNKEDIGSIYLAIANVHYSNNNDPEAVSYSFMALKYFEETNDLVNIGICHKILISLYLNQEDYASALKNCDSALKIYERLGDKPGIASIYSLLAFTYFLSERYSESLEKELASLSILEKLPDNSYNIAWSQQGAGDSYEKLGEIADSKGQKELAVNYFFKADSICKKALKGFMLLKNHEADIASCYGDLGLISTKIKKYSAAKDYLQKALNLSIQSENVFALRETYKFLSGLDSTLGRFGDAYTHYKLFVLYRDSISTDASKKKLIQSSMQYETEKKEAIIKEAQEKKDAEAAQRKRLQYFIMAALLLLVLVFILIASIQWRNNKQKKKANILLSSQKTKIENTLSELKLTQAQLIQSEKMASLGELTAGIAHEIQNPLNFVNNFSEVNSELLQELKQEIEKGNLDEIKAIANDIINNEEKITHHGKRADSIVKGMLQHSRTSTGQKEPTDINALAEEYLRLSFQGLRAKDKSFNATLQTDFDNNIGKINIIPQDIGRVLLNLYNNAFYAISDKSPVAGKYSPTLMVSTKRVGDKVEIIIKDNGNGIPQNVIDKIFQPFFTTKPTGKGTGLGLSLSYDIIKAHGGELMIETKEGEYAAFTVSLPKA